MVDILSTFYPYPTQRLYRTDTVEKYKALLRTGLDS
jgi:hypothetical protein